MKAIIFGAGGQDGIYLSGLLKMEKYEVVAITRSNVNFRIQNFEEVCTLVKQHTPAYIFHFAAESTTRHDAWKTNHETISTGTFNILEAVKQYSPGTKVFISGSALQFRNEGKPLNETAEFDATSAYVVSRNHSVFVARYYRTLGIKAYVGYFFNHDSPYRSERHINKRIIETVKRIGNGSKEILIIGDLEVQKEFGFALDTVKAVLTLVKQDNKFEAVIGTGKAYPISEWVDICFSLYGLNPKLHVKSIVDYRSEYNILVSDPATIVSLGWKPETDIHSLAKIMSEA